MDRKREMRQVKEDNVVWEHKARKNNYNQDYYNNYNNNNNNRNCWAVNENLP